MPTVKLESVQMPEASLTEKVIYLADLVARYKKELEYYLNNLDSENITSLEGSVIKNLGKQYSDEEALAAWEASNYATYIDSAGVYTGTLTALQVNAVAISASSITTGTLSANRISGGTISGVTIDVTTDAKIGKWLTLAETTFVGGIRWGADGDQEIYIDPAGELLVIASIGNVEINADALYVQSEIYVTGDILPDSTKTYDLGSTSKRWNLYGGSAYLTGTLYCNEVRDTAVTGTAVYVNSSAKLGYLSSTIKHKENIVPYDFDFSKMMALEVVEYNYKKEIMDDQSKQLGCIAEQAIEAGLEQFVVFNKDGSPRTFKYDMLGVANLSLIQQQEKRIKELEARLLKGGL